MNCTRCGAVLRDAAKFCGVCSHPTISGTPQNGQPRSTRRSSWLTTFGVSSTNAFLVGAGALVFGSLLAVGISANFRTGQSSLPATAVPATAVPATAVPATAVPATAVPATAVPATAVPATAVPATAVPATAVPATAVPATAVPATAVPPSRVPATAVLPTRVPPPVSPVKHVWPQIARDNFVNVCSAASGGRASYCICALEKLQIVYSIQEFLELERRYSNGIPFPDVVVNIMSICVLES